MTTQDSVHKLLGDMQDKLTVSHTNLNRMFKEMASRQNKVEKSYDEFQEKMETIESVNKMIEGRTSQHAKHLEKAQVTLDNVVRTKQDKSNF